MKMQDGCCSHFRRVAPGLFSFCSYCYSINLRAFCSVYLHKQTLKRVVLARSALCYGDVPNEVRKVNCSNAVAYHHKCNIP